MNHVEDRGHTSLWISSLRGHVDVVKILLSQHNIDVNAHDLSGVSPLWAACQNNMTEVVKLLLRSGAEPNLAKKDGCTPVWIASSRGHEECLKLLIKHGADLNVPDKSQGATALFVACQNGKKEIVEILVSSDADIDKARTESTTPLMMAAHNGHTEIVAMMLRYGANAKKTNVPGLSSIGCAAMQGHLEITKILYQHVCSNAKQQEVVTFVNGEDYVNGWTPLQLACMGGHEHVAKYLVNEVKVDIFKKDYENKTALEHAWQNGHQSIVAWLSQLEASYSRR